MKFVALVSGGKDSIYSACRLIDDHHELVGILHIQATDEWSDSYMFQTVGSECAEKIAECFGVPFRIQKSLCRAKHLELEYSCKDGDEVEDIFLGLREMRKEIEFDAVSSGAILSRYQKNRVDDVCSRLGLMSIAPLWERRDRELLKEMIEYGIDARVIKVASPLLKGDCVGKSLPELYSFLADLEKQGRNNSDLNYCGEGGEYETIVFDCKHFIKRIVAAALTVMPHPEEKERDGCVFYGIYSGVELVKKCSNAKELEM